MIGSGLIQRLKPYFQTTPKAGPVPTAPQQPATGPASPVAQVSGAPPQRAATPASQPAPPPPDAVASGELANRHEQLARKLAELQWDLGGLTYEMAIRDHFRLDLLVRKAAEQRAVDAELAAVERILRLEQAGSAGTCPSCGALYSRGAVFCWQCGSTLTAEAPIATPQPPPAAPQQAPPRPQAAPQPPAAMPQPPPQQPPSPPSQVPPAASSPPPGNGAAPAEAPQPPAATAPEKRSTPPGGGEGA